jgi:hypothetical protein
MRPWAGEHRNLDREERRRDPPWREQYAWGRIALFALVLAALALVLAWNA